MNDDNYSIRNMHRKELDFAINWAAAEGWNPGLHDADTFYATDPEGFLIGLLDDKPVASISAVRYGERFGFIGFYIVKPEHRGKGYGLQIWNSAMEHLQDRVIGLDGVVDQQYNYKKSGFELAHRNIRYEGFNRQEENVQNPNIQSLSSRSFEDLVTYDRSFFPGDRKTFLRHWIDQADAKGQAYLRNEQIVGYGVIRKCRSGYKIGPLFADRPEWAQALFLALTSPLDSKEPFYLDIPATNDAAVKLCSKHDMTASFETARMYRGKIPDLPIDRTFGITTFELG